MSILKVENMYKRFGKQEVLKGVCFSMEKGEVVSIIGSSGSGKTTFLRCINFLEKADHGTISVDDQLVFDASKKELSQSELRKIQLNFGLVFQSFNLFPQYSAFENVTLAPKLLARERADFKKNKKEIYAEIYDKALDLFDRVGLSDKITNYPCQLSGGQQQRVSIARALMLNPKVLFFDEPTSALDPEITNEVLKVIRSLADRNMTMVIVTHEMAFARSVSDRIIFMNEGIVEEEGTADEVFSNPKSERLREFLSISGQK